MLKRFKKCVYFHYMLCKTFLHTLVFADASSHSFLTFCRIDILRVLRQSFYGKFQILCGFWNPANPAFRMYGSKHLDDLDHKAECSVVAGSRSGAGPGTINIARTHEGRENPGFWSISTSSSISISSSIFRSMSTSSLEP